jgi:hypothetical protein
MNSFPSRTVSGWANRSRPRRRAPQRRGRVVSAVVAVAISVGIAACGDDASAPTTTATPRPTTTVLVTTKADFIAHGDQILCEKTTAVAAATASVGGEADPTVEELEALILDGVLPAVQRAHDDLSRLPVPAGDEAQVTAIVDAIQAAIDMTTEDPAILLGDPDPFAAADGLILAYGLTGCPT